MSARAKAQANAILNLVDGSGDQSVNEFPAVKAIEK